MAAKKEKSGHSAETISLFNELIAPLPGIERKGATMPYTSLNGNMFSLIVKSGALALRLPPEAREEFLKKYKTVLFEAYGAVMKEYVLVPEKLFKNIKELKPWFGKSFEYVKTLKPKPAKKK